MSADAREDAIHRRISQLVEEEHALESGRAAPLEEHRLEGISTELDQCWDLLRQRHARTAAGLDPDTARPRPPSVVTAYLQ